MFIFPPDQADWIARAGLPPSRVPYPPARLAPAGLRWLRTELRLHTRGVHAQGEGRGLCACNWPVVSGPRRPRFGFASGKAASGPWRLAVPSPSPPTPPPHLLPLSSAPQGGDALAAGLPHFSRCELLRTGWGSTPSAFSLSKPCPPLVSHALHPQYKFPRSFSNTACRGWQKKEKKKNLTEHFRESSLRSSLKFSLSQFCPPLCTLTVSPWSPCHLTLDTPTAHRPPRPYPIHAPPP